MIGFFAALLVSYLVGSIPTSVWVGKLTKKIDIREHGSGNAGATNTFRMLGWKAGTVVALTDISKGFVTSKYVALLALDSSGHLDFFGFEAESFVRILCGLIAVVGHMFPLYAGFKGGKGVITAAGMLLGVEPISISSVLVLFVIILLTSHYVSLASIIATGMYPVALVIMRFVFDYPIDNGHLIIAVITSSTIIGMHKANIQRLMNGTENRIKSFRPAKGRLNKTPEEMV